MVYAGPIVVIINFVRWQRNEAQAFIFTSFWSVLRQPLCSVLLLGASIAISWRIVQQVKIAGGNAWCGEAAYQLVAENELVTVQSDDPTGASSSSSVDNCEECSL